MSKVLVSQKHFEDIASAIRSKNEESTRYKPGDMARAIRLIPTGGGSVLETLTVTENGLYTPDDGVDGYSTVTVSVSTGILPEDEGKVVQNGALVPQTSLNVTANGTVDTTTNNSVTVDVSGSGGASYSGAALGQAGVWTSVSYGLSGLSWDTRAEEYIANE